MAGLLIFWRDFIPPAKLKLHPRSRRCAMQPRRVRMNLREKKAEPSADKKHPEPAARRARKSDGKNGKRRHKEIFVGEGSPLAGLGGWLAAAAGGPSPPPLVATEGALTSERPAAGDLAAPAGVPWPRLWRTRRSGSGLEASPGPPSAGLGWPWSRPRLASNCREVLLSSVEERVGENDDEDEVEEPVHRCPNPAQSSFWAAPSSVWRGLKPNVAGEELRDPRWCLRKLRTDAQDARRGESGASCRES